MPINCQGSIVFNTDHFINAVRTQQSKILNADFYVADMTKFTVVPGRKISILHYQCLIVFAMMNPQVITCIITQKVLKNNAIRASFKVKMGTSGRSWSVCPIRWPVALAQIRSMLFNETDPIRLSVPWLLLMWLPQQWKWHQSMAHQLQLDDAQW